MNPMNNPMAMFAEMARMMGMGGAMGGGGSKAGKGSQGMYRYIYIRPTDT
jgi:hypothetical protein